MFLLESWKKCRHKLLESFPRKLVGEIPEGTLDNFMKDLWKEPYEKLCEKFLEIFWKKFRKVLLQWCRNKTPAEIVGITSVEIPEKNSLKSWKKYRTILGGALGANSRQPQGGILRKTPRQIQKETPANFEENPYINSRMTLEISEEILHRFLWISSKDFYGVTLRAPHGISVGVIPAIRQEISVSSCFQVVWRWPSRDFT